MSLQQMVSSQCLTLGSSFLIENVVLFAINFAGCQCQALTVYF
ncbi:MAG: hypothetical protein ACR5LA_10975 [Wolbachia sp.]